MWQRPDVRLRRSHLATRIPRFTSRFPPSQVPGPIIRAASTKLRVYPLVCLKKMAGLDDKTRSSPGTPRAGGSMNANAQMGVVDRLPISYRSSDTRYSRVTRCNIQNTNWYPTQQPNEFGGFRTPSADRGSPVTLSSRSAGHAPSHE